MTFDDPLLAAFFGDDAVAALWSPSAQLAHMVAFERALVAARAAVGQISPADALAADAHLVAWTPDFELLAGGVAADGLVVPAFARMIREGAPVPEIIHTGATSQDVLDSALAMTLDRLIGLYLGRLDKLSDAFRALQTEHGTRRLMGRTRMQAALPILAGSRIRTWIDPVAHVRAQLEAMRPRVARVQLGGAVGDRHRFGPAAAEIADGVADRLGLSRAPAAWHTDRTAIAEFASALSVLTGTLGKFGADVTLMAQQGVDEIRLAGGGGSSAMPHKQNPVHAELLVTLARYNAAQVGAMHSALVHEQERSGAAWTLEWLTLPPMTVAAGRALTAATELAGAVTSIGQIE
ncbi:3-carboxy-cis,cis-muconate cycloisomerase [Acuticoccus sp. MNP-M23]|uniref:3-carboxy-cis,cis-muconate cycloisomerase n=1 Tax=Acuticoccus sp. MNP-M23 TaxID=3072793 RepID=UPI002814CA44|nr:3-carboxy-cis,cis-muconate cycloisomerase [Acuticoccus sp. MNP-M23]WMS43524.1 3-carboxy-cis,cis-muconate cycloisomerase [Acuticoccus sp. MNP-M23]